MAKYELQMPLITRRSCIAGAFVALALAWNGITEAASQPESRSTEVEQWGLYEVALSGPTNGNPFVDVRVTTRFDQGDDSIEATGFYDGDGVYRARLMPPKPGLWRYRTASSVAALNDHRGEFTVTKCSARNHGPVHVTNTFHFA